MPKAKSEALNRKKEEKATDNLCKKCGSKKHSTKLHGKTEEDIEKHGGETDEKLERDYEDEDDDESKEKSERRQEKRDANK